MKRRVFLVVLDSFGIGYEPDAADFGDVGSNTLATIMKSEYYNTPNMKKLGLFNIDAVEAESREEKVHMAECRKGQGVKIQQLDIGKLQGLYQNSHCLLIRMDFRRMFWMSLRKEQAERFCAINHIQVRK